MLLAAILAMVLAAAAPAFAQASVDLGEDDAGDNQYNTGQQNEQNTVVQDSICTNVNNAAANQYEGGDQAAAAEAGDVIGDTNSAASAANIANALGLTQAQVNACLNQVNATSSASPVASVPSVAPSASAPQGGGGGGGGGGGTASAAGGGGSASAAAGGELPSTGGSSLFALGAGALLVAGGLLARRIVR